MAGRFEAVLFDLGGVFTGSPMRAIETLGEELGAEPGHLFEIIFGPEGSDGDHPWHRLERAELPLPQAAEEIAALGARESLEIDLERVFALLGQDGGSPEQVADHVRKVHRAGYRTALVTNNAREFREYWRTMLPLDELFDTVVDSSEVGMRKPDPRIYRLTLERLGGVAPDRSVLLDDFPGNLAAAERLGIHAILVGRDPFPALQELEALLGI